MPTANEKSVDQVMRQGNVVYVYDPSGKHSYPWRANTAGVPPIAVSDSAGTMTAILGDTGGIIGQRVSMIFRPGSTVMTSGAVPTGTRSGAQTITTLATADVTVWGPESIFYPKEIGKIDGVSTGGIISGQITIGVKSAAGTVNAKVIGRIRNNPTASTGDASAWDTLIPLSAATATTTAETYLYYDIPYLLTSASCNAVPMGVAIGMQTAVAASATIGRIMESSYITFDVVPGT